MDEYIRIIENSAKKIKGLSIGIVNKDGFVFEHYHGVIDENKTPNDSNRKMMIGSNTKILTTIAILQLMEQGKLNLDDEVSKHLPDLKVLSHFKYKEITIRNVLMHRSGLPSDDMSLLLNENRTMSELIPILNKSYMATKPDTMYSYSNLGYTLLGLIIEKLSGLSYVDYIDKYISKPIKAEFVFLKNQTEKEAYFDSISRSFNSKGKVVFDPLGMIIPAGSNTYAKLSDLMKLMKCFLDPDNQTLLLPDTIRMMMEKPQNKLYEDYEWRHGIGLFFHRFNYASEETGDLIGHGGDTIYHHSDFQFYPKLGFGIVYLTNTMQGNIVGSSIMRKLFLEELKKLDKKVPKREISIPNVVNKESSNFMGFYVTTSGLTLNVSRNKKNELIGKLQFLKAQLLLQEDGWFYLKPRGLAKLSIFKKMIKNIYLKPKKLYGEEVVYVKQIRGVNLNVLPFFGKYEPINQIDKYQHLLGNYQRVTEFVHCQETGKDISLRYKKGMLYIQFKLFNTRMKLYISPINENQFLIKGYGRDTHETVTFSTEKNDIYMSCLGVSCQKIK